MQIIVGSSRRISAITFDLWVLTHTLSFLNEKRLE
jgi:hypothetical protein